MNGKVSVIVPMYNAEKFIVKTIESLLGQTYIDLEIIVIDDGSKDNSYDIVKKMFGDKVKLLHKKNGGVSETRNYGLDHATGKYIMFVDSDDIAEMNMVSTCMEYIDDYDQVIFNNEIIDEAGNHIGYSTFEARNIILSDNNRMDFFVNEFFNHKCGWCVWNRIFKREIIENNNIRFSTKYKIGEDQLFCLEYMLYITKVKVIKDSLYRYVIQPNSIMRTNVVDLDKKSEMVLDRISLSASNSIYHYMMIYSEKTQKNKKEIKNTMKSSRGNFWRFKLFFSALSFKIKAKIFTRAKIIKRTIFI